MPFKDPEKRNEYKKEWYANNASKERQAIKNRKQKIKKWFLEYRKSLSCSKCEESHPATLDFHHTKNKEKQVAQMVHWGYSIENIKNEIGKCQVLCANCHRKLHWKKTKTLKPNYHP